MAAVEKFATETILLFEAQHPHKNNTLKWCDYSLCNCGIAFNECFAFDLTGTFDQNVSRSGILDCLVKKVKENNRQKHVCANYATDFF